MNQVDFDLDAEPILPIPADQAPLVLKPHDRLDQFEILQEIGSGGVGIVFKALDTYWQRVVALKELGPEWAANPESRMRFIDAARAAADVHDEHVVTVFGVEGIDATPYLVMEFVDGISLQQRLEQKEPLELADILRIGAHVAKGLAAAHAHWLIHGDIKPSNILLDKGGRRTKITDFNLARAVDDGTLTQCGAVRGSTAYMSPEQAANKEVDHRSDLFSLGSVLYAMCAGQDPFHSSDSLTTWRKVRDEEPIWIKDLNPQIPDWLVALIARLHAKDPRDRIPSAMELARMLDDRLAKLTDPSRGADIPVGPKKRP